MNFGNNKINLKSLGRN